MSMAIGHFALGYGATTGVLLATGLHKKIKNTEPIKVVGGGIWAILPDAHYLIPSLKILHDGWWTDIFWFHRLIDKFDSTDSVFISTVSIGFMLLMLMIFWKVTRR